MLDAHIHLWDGPDGPDTFYGKLQDAGFSGGSLISRAPESFLVGMQSRRTAAERVDEVLQWCSGMEELYPLFWIDPLEDGAVDQVHMAAESGVLGFKVICDRYFPGDDTAMTVYSAIAALGKPLLFHSGILWDGKVSSKFNRPGEFESMLEVDKLIFALAHISWPWTNECIAVYGKFLNAVGRRPGLSSEMYVDVTPGTPPIYREDALMKLTMTGYDIADNVLFGVDSMASNYNPGWAGEWIQRDSDILDRLGLSDIKSRYFGDNLKRFLGLIDIEKEKAVPHPGQ